MPKRQFPAVHKQWLLFSVASSSACFSSRRPLPASRRVVLCLLLVASSSACLSSRRPLPTFTYFAFMDSTSSASPDGTPAPAVPVPTLLKLPTDLSAWRIRLFAVSTSLQLSADEWTTYWPFIDNVYSALALRRNTDGSESRHWNCRMRRRTNKPRAAIGASSKRRSRTIREGNTCNFALRITTKFDVAGSPVSYEISRVRSCPDHSHTLDESDMLKENSFLRIVAGAEASKDYRPLDRKSTRLNSSHRCISYAV